MSIIIEGFKGITFSIAYYRFELLISLAIFVLTI